MLDRLRQAAFIVKDVQEGETLYRRILGLRPSLREELHEYSLTSVVMPAGCGTFIELVQPTSDHSPAARYLSRRGEAPYLLVFETSQYDQLVPHLRSMGVRVTSETTSGDYRSAFIHPGDANGAFLEIVEPASPDNPWPPAGPGWQTVDTPEGIIQLRQMAILVNDLDQAIERWSAMFGLAPTRRFQISFTGLEIAVLPLNDRRTFIELAQPTSPDTSSARFLERYGEGIYLTIFEIEDSLATDARLQQQDIRFTTSRRTENYVNLGFNSIWLHPASMKGAFIQLSQVLSEENPWPPAGDDWYL